MFHDADRNGEHAVLPKGGEEQFRSLSVGSGENLGLGINRCIVLRYTIRRYE